ncbi:TrkA C-terminal domain-containing protein [Chloroflexota bacterium]
MPYVGILLITIFIYFIIVLIGGFALQLTGIEPEVARFQALSAFSGTGFTTTEAERVVRHRTRRRIVTALIIMGNAGLVAIIATSVASFTQVSGYEWYFIRLAIIIVGIFILYSLIIRSRVGNQIMYLFRKPLMTLIMREAPVIDEIYLAKRDWGISLVMVKEFSKNIGLSLADVTRKENIVILAIDRVGTTLEMPTSIEKIMEGDRLLVYGNKQSIKQIFS